jgi:two-component system, sensor histidine kinase
VQILIVAEDLAAVESTSHLLETWGCEIAHAASRAEADAYLHQAERVPDLLIAACDQGGAEAGLTMIEAVRAAAGSPIPAFLIGTEGTASVSGVEILHVPVRPAELRALIAHLLEASV